MPKIKEVSLALTYACNCDCKMCIQREPYRKDFMKHFPSEMKLEDWIYVIDQLEPYRDNIDYVYLAGGEPLLVPYILDLIKYIKKKRYICTVNTKGRMLMQYADDIILSGVDIIILSVDGCKDIHDLIRKRSGGYDELVFAIREINSKRKFRPRIFVNCVIQEDNIEQLEQWVEEMQNLHVDQIYLHLQTFVSSNMAAAYEKDMKEKFAIEAFAHKGAVCSPSMDINKIRAVCLKLKDKNIHMLHDIEKVNLENYYNYPDRPFRLPIMTKCFAANNVLEIMPDGSVITCHDFPDYIVGNVRNEKLLEIWNGEKMQKFRRYVTTERLLPICQRCCMSERYAAYDDGNMNVLGAFR